MLPTIDAHAHVDVRIAPSDLEGLDAFVFAVTRSLDESDGTRRRRDPMTLWGVGCHPSVPAAVSGFSGARFARAIESAAFVGEVGLDRRSRVPMERQVTVLCEILRAVQTTPRPVSLHSTGATTAVLDALEQYPVAMPILHWWRGSRAETLRALELGCLFSLNGHEAHSPKVIELIPLERVITETDFPHSLRYDRAAHRPGAVSTTESLIGTRHGISRSDLRVRLWLTLATVLNAVPRRALSAEMEENIERARGTAQPDGSHDLGDNR
jgi:TatD DNase family protein